MAATMRSTGKTTIILFSLLWVWVLGWRGSVVAQDAPPAALFITSADASSPPSIEIQVYGLSSQGDAINFGSTPFELRQDNAPIISYELAGTREVGTLTIFLIDIPGGVSGQLDQIAAAINEYADAPTMKEQQDAVAIYRVGDRGATQMLAPTKFYNSVRNLLADPLELSTGSTALVDSMGSLLQQLDTLKPEPEMAANFVILSDGTDAVSSQFAPEDIAVQAAERGVAIHTIALNNTDLSEGGLQQGQDYLAQLATGARGLAIKLENQADWPIVWNRIAGFRNQTRLRLTAPNLQGGVFPISINLADQPEVTAVTEVSIPLNTPSVTLNLPEESRTLTLPDLADPVQLRFSAAVSWLDAVERGIEAAQLVINGVPQDIPVETLADFEVEVSNLGFGQNSVQVVILDEQGMKVTSPSVSLMVNEGRREIPEELDGGGGFLQTLLRLVVIALVVAILVVGLFFIWRQGWLTRLPSLQTLLPRGRSRPRPVPEVTVAAPDEAEAPRVLARLHILESITRMPVEIGLTQPRLRLGRSPSQTDIAFENDITMSRLHATLMLEGTQYRVFDEGSTSGTWVNERQVPEYGMQLVDGDEIHLGAVHLRFYQP